VRTEPEVSADDDPVPRWIRLRPGAKSEELIDELRQDYSFVIVTTLHQQAARVSQRTAVLPPSQFWLIPGTDKIFTRAPRPLGRKANH